MKKLISIMIVLIIILGVIIGYDIINSRDEFNGNPKIEELPDNNSKDDEVDEEEEPDNDFIDKSYYLEDNLDEYENYQNNNPDLSEEEIISIINSNADLEGYSEIKNTDVSKGDLLIVNKFYKLSEDFVPENLITPNEHVSRSSIQIVDYVFDSFKQMLTDNDELDLTIFSGYRSYSTQQRLYNDYVAQDGVEEADTYSARAGHSEHQTGLAIDLTTPGGLYDAFKDTYEYEWLKDNAHKYGFIIRYPEGKTNLTKYKFEPWHYRYVGIDAATYLYENNITFDEYYPVYIEKEA